jgi:hypothetical protein
LSKHAACDQRQGDAESADDTIVRQVIGPDGQRLFNARQEVSEHIETRAELKDFDTDD